MLKVENGVISLKKSILLQDINTDIKPDELTVIVGPNGSGKTSLLNIFAKNQKLSSGILTNTFKKSILIPQNLYYPNDITLFEYVSSIFYKDSFKWFLSNDDKTEIDHILDKLNLIDKKDRLLKNLSAGELQLSNIALCLISRADLILLDEPTSNLDLVNQVMILDIVKELTTQNISVVIVMHDIQLASKYGDKFVLISKDSNLMQGTKEQVLTCQNLSDAYNVDFEKIGIYLENWKYHANA